jgi:hypothetical protein
MEPTTGIEPVDLFLTKEALYRLSYVGHTIVNVWQVNNCKKQKHTHLSWSGRRDSNSRHPAWKAEALPTELLPPSSPAVYFPNIEMTNMKFAPKITEIRSMQEVM